MSGRFSNFQYFQDANRAQQSALQSEARVRQQDQARWCPPVASTYLSDGTQKPRSTWARRITLSLAVLFGIASIALFIITLIGCQTKSLSNMYLLRLQDNQSSDEVRFGYFGVCTTKDAVTSCYPVGASLQSPSGPKFLYGYATVAQSRLQHIFTYLLLASAVLILGSAIIMTIYRLGPRLLPYDYSEAIRDQSTALASSILVCTWLSFLLTWLAAGIVQQVTTALAEVTGSGFDDTQSRYTFNSGKLSLGMHWGLASLVTLYAVAVTGNLLGIGTIKSRAGGGKGGGVESYFDWNDTETLFDNVARRYGTRGSVVYWA